MKKFTVICVLCLCTVFTLLGCAKAEPEQTAQGAGNTMPDAVLKAAPQEPNTTTMAMAQGTLPAISSIDPANTIAHTMGAQMGMSNIALAAGNIKTIAAVEKITAKTNAEGFSIYTGGKLAAYGNKPLRIASYKALAELVKTELAMQHTYFTADSAKTANEAASADGMGGGGASGSYSETNLQVAGVDEADTIKTDGKYIYVVAEDGILILNPDLSKAALVKKPENTYVSQIYIDGDRLTVLYNLYKDGEVTIQQEENGVMAKMIMPITSQYTCATVYDISDKANIRELKTYKIEGYLNQSRKQGDVLYLVTTKYVYSAIDDGKEIVPYYYDSAVGGTAKPLPITDVLCLPYPSPESCFTTVSAIDTANPETSAQAETFLGGNENLYMNENGLYLVSSKYNYSSETWSVDAVINRFQVNGLDISYKATGTVAGSILNQFSMNEHNGYFGIATTENGNNRLFLLDTDLKRAGSVENLAKGERIYAVRFMGDTAYVVTFENIDPLFVIDIKDPTNPKVLGELKVPGFSNYLHPVAEGYLLGIGQDTTEIYKRDRNGKEVVIGTQQEGIKLSLFDVRDPAAPKEVDTYVIGENGSYTEVFYDHKALLTKASEGLFGFNAGLAYGKNYNYEQNALIFKVDTTGIKLQAQLPAKTNADYNYTLFAQGRLCYIGNTVYYVQNDVITAYDMQTYKEVKSKSF